MFLKFTLNEQDRINMKFVYDHQVEINQIIATYSTIPFRFDYKDIDLYIARYEQITCKIQIDTLNNTAWLLDHNAEDVEKFIYAYFTYFHLIQHCIAIHNTLHPTPEEHRHALHATFAMIGSYRNLLHYEDSYTIGHD